MLRCGKASTRPPLPDILQRTEVFLDLPSLHCVARTRDDTRSQIQRRNVGSLSRLAFSTQQSIVDILKSQSCELNLAIRVNMATKMHS